MHRFSFKRASAATLVALAAMQHGLGSAAWAQSAPSVSNRASPIAGQNSTSAGRSTYAQLGNIHEPSAVQQLPDGRLLVVEDEAQSAFSLLRVNDDNTLVEDVAASQTMRQSIPGELSDLEALAADESGHFYAATSYSEVHANQGGRRRAQRERLVRFTLADNRMQDVRDAPNLKDALQKSTAVQQAIQDQTGMRVDFSRLNLEGMAYNKRSKHLLLGLREPQSGSQSLIITIKNPDAMFERGAEPAFGDVFALDLKGSGIRSLAYYAPADTYLIANETIKTDSRKPASQLWLWDGRARSAPRKVHLPELDTLKNAEAITVATVRGQERLVVLGDNGSRKRKRGASYFIIDAGRILPPFVRAHSS